MLFRDNNGNIIKYYLLIILMRHITQDKVRQLNKLNIIYGYAGCPVSIRDNNEKILKTFLNYIKPRFFMFYN